MGDIATIIRSTAAKRGLKLKAVADKAGMSLQCLSDFLCGRRKLSAIELIRIFKVLEIPFDTLMTINV